MKTKKQEQMIEAFLSMLEDQTRPLYQGIIQCLSELGYHPRKERSHLVFKHDLHNKQMAKVGMKKGKDEGRESPFFALRFSACRGYSQRFADIVDAFVSRYPTRTARCTSGECDYCKGTPATHTYQHTFVASADGAHKAHCGAYALEIPDVVASDVEEIRKLIQEEHAYLVKHEIGEIDS